MKYCFIVLLIGFFSGGIYCQPLTNALLEDEFNKATQFFGKNKTFETIAISNNIEPAFVYALVFPELMRYNSLHDYFETSALETFYIQYGKKYANFSIGRFQIKPVFAEILDSFYYAMGFYNFSTLDFSEAAICNLQNYTCRASRLQRLKSTACQWKYLVLFCLVMNEIYKNVVWNNKIEQLEFFAMAYNCGEFIDGYRIKKFLREQHFHISNININYKYNYAAISCFFYNKFSKL